MTVPQIADLAKSPIIVKPKFNDAKSRQLIASKWGYQNPEEAIRLEQTLNNMNRPVNARNAWRKSTYETIPEPGVHYKIDTKPTGDQVEYIGYYKVPTMDWDWPDPIHPDAAVNIENLGDAYQRVEEYAAKNPSTWGMYMTPGGIHAINMTEQATPIQFNQSKGFDILQPDPLYQGLVQRKYYPATTEGPGEWTMRTSAKPERDEDFIGHFLGTIGDAPINPQNFRLINQYHDIPIQQNLLETGLTPGILPPSGIELLERQLQSIPQKYRKKIEPSVSQMYEYYEPRIAAL
jgi:hypothetical protein